MPGPSDMTGKAVVVTGAASGLGRATALTLARAGADLCLVDVNAQGLEETAATAREAGVKVVVHAADLSQAAQCDAAIASAIETFGRLDALCNIAGILIFAHSTEMPVETWDRIFAINLRAPFLLSRAAIPHLLERNGAIVNVTSTSASIGEAYLAAYCSTKAALVQLTKAMAVEYTHKPIRINAVAPGGMMTPIGDTIRLPEGVDYGLLERIKPLRGVVEVDDVAGIVAYLASDAGRGFHGANVVIDAGQTAG